jgi:hypothetical protein
MSDELIDARTNIWNNKKASPCLPHQQHRPRHDDDGDDDGDDDDDDDDNDDDDDDDDD